MDPLYSNILYAQISVFIMYLLRKLKLSWKIFFWLRKKLVKFRDDEVEHKNTAIDEGSRKAFGYSVLRKTINETTKAAIFLAERI